MSISFQCDKCGGKLKVPDAAAGRKGRCRNCGLPVMVPARSEAAADDYGLVVEEPDDEPTPVPARAPAPAREAATPAAFAPPAAPPSVSVYTPAEMRVTVTDIDMRFTSMVWFMVKWAVASIPAAMILFGLLGSAALVFSLLFAGIIGGAAKYNQAKVERADAEAARQAVPGVVRVPGRRPAAGP
jgi:DNA-directed RNA polymerase subunit RPC12/RpoP